MACSRVVENDGTSACSCFAGLAGRRIVRWARYDRGLIVLRIGVIRQSASGIWGGNCFRLGAPQKSDARRSEFVLSGADFGEGLGVGGVGQADERLDMGQAGAHEGVGGQFQRQARGDGGAVFGAGLGDIGDAGLQGGVVGVDGG